ncbi:MAG: alpha/beta hydrolase [Proteobacteria bacterium]|nr:alpha/beta hydrolase [Pseudomonadota bacterium]
MAIRSSPTGNEAEARLREVLAPFGALTDDQWTHMVDHGFEERDGALRLRYDPAIGGAFDRGPVFDVSLWPVWDTIDCPVLVLRGGDSDLLLPETVVEMGERGPAAEAVEIPGVGHAPALMDPSQIAVVRDWLAAPTAA